MGHSNYRLRLGARSSTRQAALILAALRFAASTSDFLGAHQQANRSSGRLKEPRKRAQAL